MSQYLEKFLRSMQYTNIAVFTKSFFPRLLPPFFYLPTSFPACPLFLVCYKENKKKLSSCFWRNSKKSFFKYFLCLWTIFPLYISLYSLTPGTAWIVHLGVTACAYLTLPEAIPLPPPMGRGAAAWPVGFKGRGSKPKTYILKETLEGMPRNLRKKRLKAFFPLDDSFICYEIVCNQYICPEGHFTKA